MYPPLYEVCSVYPDVQTNLGTSPCRIYPFGEVPQDTTLPYVAWRTIGGSPENCIDTQPDIDRFSTQVNVYASTVSESRDAAKAIRDAVEDQAYVSTWGGESRDADTNNYVYVFIVEWLVHRDSVS